MKPSIGRRLFFILGLSLSLIWLAALTSTAWVVRHETEEVFDSSLQETAERLLPLLQHEIKIAPHLSESLAEVVAHREYLTYQALDRRGKVLLRSHSAPAEPFAITYRPGLQVRGDRVYFVQASPDGELIVVVAEPAGHRREALNGLLRYMVIALLALIPLTAAAVLWAVREARFPIEEFHKALSRRDGSDLRPLAIERLPSELSGVGEATNLLLERLRLALESERNFSANSAHEVRTPLAAAMAQLKVLENELPNPANRQRALQARQMLDRLYQMTTKLLQLARTESGLALNIDKFDLLPLLRMVLRDYARHDGRKFILDISEGAPPVWVQGDIDALGIALQNLIENADRYGTPDTPIRIHMPEPGEIAICNDCDPIPPEKLACLGQRFVRGEQGKPGSGLGLSIVKTVAKHSGGSLQLISPANADGRGFCAVLKLALAG